MFVDVNFIPAFRLFAVLVEDVLISSAKLKVFLNYNFIKLCK